MKKRLLFLILLVIGVGIGIGVFSSWAGLAARFRPALAAAQEEPTSTPILARQNVPPTLSAVSVSPADQLVQELSVKAAQQVTKELNAKAALGVWLHIHVEEKFDQDAPNNGVLPNGMAIPNQQINDDWYHVNAQGVVIESVSMMRTTDGKIVQVGVASNGTTWNSATSGADPEKRPQELLKLNELFLNNGDLKRLEKFGSTAKITNVSLPNGDQGVQIAIGATSAPAKITNFDKAVTSTEIRTVLDNSTGYMVSQDVVSGFEDGSQRISSQLKQNVTIEPPTDEVLYYLAEKDREVNK